jgi:hypothetical protein
MSKFLKLTNRVINTTSIKHIDYDKAIEKYSIHFGSLTSCGSVILGSGIIEVYDKYIYATKKEHPENYNIIEKYYNSITCITDEKD